MSIVETSVVLLLILLAGFFAMAEFAIVTSRGSFMVDATLPIDQVATLLRAKSLPPGDYDTVGGLAVSRLGHMPQLGERFFWESWDLQVLDTDRSRIRRLLVERHR